MLRESHALPCQTVNPRSLGYGMTVATKISVTEVVCKNKYYIGELACKPGTGQRKGDECKRKDIMDVMHLIAGC
jgi:hypothetical protein